MRTRTRTTRKTRRFSARFAVLIESGFCAKININLMQCQMFIAVNSRKLLCPHMLHNIAASNDIVVFYLTVSAQ